ncbi:MAG: hypothetical protein K2M95_03930 [Clostridiales bacterium]|nr:hypothetical protein [Clostridiales bacterium]
MAVFKKIASRLGNPKWYFLLPVVLIAIGATVGGTLIMTQPELSAYMTWGYVLLAIMGVTLSYSIFGIVHLYPKAKAGILKWAEKHPRLDRMFNEYGFTTLVLTAGSIFVTFAFAVYNGSIAIVIRSIWFGALAAYYVVLIVLRSSILIHYGRRKRAEGNGQSETQLCVYDGKLYRACGVMLFLLPVCLSFAIMQMVRAGDSFEHTGITIYVYAIYAFFKIITAVYSLIKERRNHLMTVKAIKNVKLADAFVSILALQTAMFREFGSIGDINTIKMNAITGAIVCALTIAIGVYMIVRATLRIKALKQEQETNEQSNNSDTQNELDAERAKG